MDAMEIVRRLLIGGPLDEDELASALRALTTEQAHMLALEAFSQYEEASDRRRRDDIEEFLGCLAVFVLGSLEGLHGELLVRDSLWLHPLYLGADADTRNALLLRANGDERELNGVLCALAWIGDEGVQAAFRAWHENPPEWRRRLYIPPEQYAFQAGWELDAEGSRHNLFYATAYELTPAPQEELGDSSPVTVVEPLDEHCRWCGRSLTSILDLDLRELRLAFLGLEGKRLRLAMCEWCSAFTPVYFEFDLEGTTRWSAHNDGMPEILRKITDDGGMFFESPRRLVLGPRRRTPYEANIQGVPLRQSQVGGHPTWIQDAEYPVCPGCRISMLNVGQVATEELLGTGEGITYMFLCPTCGVSTTTFQQT